MSIADNGIVKFFEDVGQNPLGPAGAIIDSIFGKGSSNTLGENLPVVGKVVSATDSIQTAIAKKTTKKKVKSGKKKTNKKAVKSRVRRTSKKRARTSLKKKRKSKSKSKKK